MDYMIGGDRWSGLSKLIEECGEAQQVAGKILGTGGVTEHWDGKGDLKTRLEDEIADVVAACAFVRDMNGLDVARIEARSREKHATFKKWHEDVRRRGT